MSSPPLSCEETQITPSEKQEMVCGRMSNDESIIETFYNCAQHVDEQSRKNELVPVPLSQERTQEEYGCAAESTCKSEDGKVEPYDQTVKFQDSVKKEYQNGSDHFSRCTDAVVRRKDQQNSQLMHNIQVFDYDNSAPHARKWSNLKSCHKILMSIAIALLHFLPPVCMTICINDRRITHAILEVCGVPDSEVERVCLILDRYWSSQLLDDATYSSFSRRYRRKYSWTVCKQQLETILSSSVIRCIKKYLDLSGNWSKFSESLQKHPELLDKQEVIDALEELKNTVEVYDDAVRYNNLKIVVDLSLTREFPYYTTSIFEVYVQYGPNSSFISGGGCYDIHVGGELQWFAVGFSVFLPIVLDLKSQSYLVPISRPVLSSMPLCMSSQHTFRHCLENQAGNLDDHQRGLDQPPTQVSRDHKSDHEYAEVVLLNDTFRLKISVLQDNT